jgi:rare lipoprotein A (peptidoglycan hydrolase)
VPTPPTTTAPPTTTTTVPAPTTTTTTPVVADDEHQSGIVTYYDDPGGPGTCASPYLPFGTVVSVTNPATGASVSCTVNDREADTARQIDLDTASFAEIAPLSQGVIYGAGLAW